MKVHDLFLLLSWKNWIRFWSGPCWLCFCPNRFLKWSWLLIFLSFFFQNHSSITYVIHTYWIFWYILLEISKKKFIRFSLLQVCSKMVKGQFWKYRLTDFEVQISGHLVEVILCGEFGTPLVPLWFEKWKKRLFHFSSASWESHNGVHNLSILCFWK